MNKIILSLLLLVYGLNATAQNWIGASNGNYSGTNGVYLNPASIVDSRHTAYINFFGMGGNFYNNYISYQGELTFLQSQMAQAVLDSTNFKENLNGKDKVINISSEVRGPSFMVSLGKKHAIALTTRNRMFVQAVDVSQPIARMIYWGLDSTKPSFTSGGPDGLSFEQLYTDTRFGININNFFEAGLSYATVLVDNKKHFLKAGITGKYLAGIYSFYFKNDGGNGLTIKGEDSLELSNTSISYGYVNEALYYSNNKITADAANVFGPNRVGKGYGLDIGFTYEFRPRYKEYKYTMDGSERWDKTENKYLLRISGTVMDIGSIRYNSEQYVRSNQLAKNKVVTWGSMDTVKQIFESIDSLPDGVSVFNRFDNAIGAVFGFDGKSNEFVSKLPTAFNLQADIKVLNNFYVNVLWLQGLRKKGAIGARQFSMLAATPRFETRWIEAAIPIVLNNDYRNLVFGLSFRFGPFFFGSDNISGLIQKKNVNGFDLYAGVALPLFKRNLRDRDGDKVSDKRDRCRDLYGKWEFSGCPDTDGDGIEDSKDKCELIPGKIEFLGCPDTDNDSIEDTKDECPQIPGPLAFNGCPDTDGDGIEDRKDSCIYLKGTEEFNGCPDSDNDKVEDRVDNCPEEPGKIELAGCPDKDNDGVRDIDDKCPDVAGPVEYKGCPDSDLDGIPDNIDKCPDTRGLKEYGGCPDTDSDGVPDHKDLCPMEAGLMENNGCPKVEEQIEIVELEEEEEKVLREAFDNLEFETGKSIMRQESYASLDELVILMNSKPAYRLYIAGHTDNVGNKKANTKLSEDRAKAVKNYLVSKGIGADRIKTEGFGDSRPIAPNTTPTGRQKNRRVEFKVIK